MNEALCWAKRENREVAKKLGESERVDFPEVNIGDSLRLGDILETPYQIPNPIPDDGYFSVKYPINNEDTLTYHCRFSTPETAQAWQLIASESDEMEDFIQALSRIFDQEVWVLNMTLDER